MDALDEHIKACLAGDTDRFEEVVKACESKVRGVLGAMIPDHDLIPDLTQEVFLIAFRKLSSYQIGSNFMAWVSAIARNVAQNERRRWYRRQELKDKCRVDAEQKMEENIEQFVDSLPEDVLESLRQCVDGLGDRTKAIVNHYYHDQCSIKNLTEIFKLTSSAAKVTLHRARQAVNKCMRRKGSGA
ncbi:MAG: sigma-70 family RNA polymerase sigma factor [Verrucomicrobiota bacterium]